MRKAGRIEKCTTRFITGILLVLSLVLFCPSFKTLSHAEELATITSFNDTCNIACFVPDDDVVTVTPAYTGILTIKPYTLAYMIFSVPRYTASNNVDGHVYNAANFQPNLNDAVLLYDNVEYHPIVISESYNSVTYRFQIINRTNGTYSYYFTFKPNISASVLIKPSESASTLPDTRYFNFNLQITNSISSFAHTNSRPLDDVEYELLVAQNSMISEINNYVSGAIRLLLSSMNSIMERMETQIVKQTQELINQSAELKTHTTKLEGIYAQALKQNAELIKQTTELTAQTEESKKQTQAQTKYDNAGKMDTDTTNLGTVIKDYDSVENSLFESAGSHISNFDISLGLTFHVKILSSITFLSTIIIDIITAMGDYSIIYTAGMCLVAIGILLGLWKFVSSSSSS